MHSPVVPHALSPHDTLKFVPCEFYRQLRHNVTYDTLPEVRLVLEVGGLCPTQRLPCHLAP